MRTKAQKEYFGLSSKQRIPPLASGTRAEDRYTCVYGDFCFVPVLRYSGEKQLRLVLSGSSENGSLEFLRLG